MRLSFASTLPLLLLGSVASFSVPHNQNSIIGAAGSHRHVLAPRENGRKSSLVADERDVVQVDESSVEINGDVVGSVNGVKSNVASSKSTDKPTGDVSKSSVTSQKSTKSELEQFVIDIRSLYQDLELGGGSVRREMNGLSFTYVAPCRCEQSAQGSNSLDGAWRKQTPVTSYGADADWSTIHKQTTKERMKYADSSNPLPLLVYLPGLDGFGISATNQFDDLASTFELWRITVGKGNLSLSFADLMNSVVKFVDDATRSCDSPREVIVTGESFGGLLACAVSMALKGSAKFNINLKGMVLVNPATSFDETNWEQFVPLLTSLRYLEIQEEIVDDRGNFRLSDLPTPYSVSNKQTLSNQLLFGLPVNSSICFSCNIVLFIGTWRHELGSNSSKSEAIL